MAREVIYGLSISSDRANRKSDIRSVKNSLRSANASQYWDLERACFGLWIIERGMLHLERACCGLMAYRTRNVTFRARLLWFMASRTRNVTFETGLI